LRRQFDREIGNQTDGTNKQTDGKSEEERRGYMSNDRTQHTAEQHSRLVPIFIDDTNIKKFNEKREKGLRE
jgi:hypothetical protein